jgi:hypothetical protein
VLAAAVAHADVEHPVGAELELPAVVDVERLVDGEYHALGGEVDALRPRVGAELRDERLQVRRFGGVVDIEVAVVGELRVEGDAEQAALEVDDDLLREVEVRRGEDLAVDLDE